MRGVTSRPLPLGPRARGGDVRRRPVRPLLAGAHWVARWFPPRSETNLKREAAKRGVSDDRILFTGKFGDDHLEYKRAASIFVDSPEYNAHVSTPRICAHPAKGAVASCRGCWQR